MRLLKAVWATVNPNAGHGPLESIITIALVGGLIAMELLVREVSETYKLAVVAVLSFMTGSNTVSE